MGQHGHRGALGALPTSPKVDGYESPGAFRKKPVVVQAYRWSEDCQNRVATDWPPWLKAAANLRPEEEGALFGGEGGRVFIHTFEGDHEVRVGDWIIQGVQGELYPCKPEIFVATYEPA